jgi:hypothetical protein
LVLVGLFFNRHPQEQQVMEEVYDISSCFFSEAEVVTGKD